MVDFYFESLFSVQEFHNTTTNVFVTNFCYHLLPRISPCFMTAMSEFRCQILGLRLRRLCNIVIDKKGRARARAGPGEASRFRGLFTRVDGAERNKEGQEHEHAIFI